MDEYVYPDAQVHHLFCLRFDNISTSEPRPEKKTGSGLLRVSSTKWRTFDLPVIDKFLMIQTFSDLNIHAMRMGPGKHLRGRTLMGGIVKPEEFDYFHEVGGFLMWLVLQV